MASLHYVVLHHKGIPEPHYDLMFETSPGSELATWRTSDWPLHHGSALARLADHRRAYLDYEGPVSGNRGTVKRITTGTYLLATNRDGLFEATLSDTGTELTFIKDGPERWVCYFGS
jgi:hypothetical protein